MRYILAALIALPLLPSASIAQTYCRPSAFGGYNCNGDGGYTRIRPSAFGGYNIRSTNWNDPDENQDCRIKPSGFGGFKYDCY